MNTTNFAFVKRAVACGMAFALTLGCLVFPANAASAVEDFESGALGAMPSGWKYYGDPLTTEAQISVSADLSHSGSKSLRIEDANIADTQPAPRIQKTYTGTSSVTEYVVSAWCNVVKCNTSSGNFGIGVSVEEAKYATRPEGDSNDPAKQPSYAMMYTTQSAGAGWVHLSHFLSYDASPSKLIALFPTKNASTGLAYFDDVSLTPVTAQTAPVLLREYLCEEPLNKTVISHILQSSALNISGLVVSRMDDYISQLALPARNRFEMTVSFIQSAVNSVNAAAATQTASAAALSDLTAKLHAASPDTADVLSALKNPALGVSATVTDANIEGYINALKAVLPAVGTLSAAQINTALTTVNTARSGKEDSAILSAVNTEIKNATGYIIRTTDEDHIDIPSVANQYGASLVWDKIISDPLHCVTISGNQIKILSRPENTDAPVLATLKISCGTANPTLCVMRIMVKPYSDTYYALASAAKKLDITAYLNGQSADNVRNNIAALPTSFEDASVSWETLDASAMAPCSYVDPVTGAVTRPTLDENNAAVLLRGTFTKDHTKYTHDYPIIIAAKAMDSARTIALNGDFETDASGWILTDRSASVERTVAHSFIGSASLCIKKAPKTAQRASQSVKSFGVRDGYTYRLSAAALSETADNDPTLTLTFRDSNGAQISSVSTDYFGVSSQTSVWKYLSLDAIAPAGAVKVTATLSATSASLSECWFDAVSLCELPIIDTNRVSAWNGEGVSVQNGILSLEAGACATSDLLAAQPNGLYYVRANGGAEITLRFFDENRSFLTSQSAVDALCAYAPSKTAYANISFSSDTALEVSDIHFAPSGYGANIGVSSGWTLNKAELQDSKISVQTGGSAVSPLIPVQEGKEYRFYATCSNATGTMQVNFYNQDGAKITTNHPSSRSAISGSSYYVLSCIVPAADVAPGNAETRYARVTLSNAANFSNTRVYALSTSISNASMENGSANLAAFFPYGWSTFGNSAAYSAKGDNQYTDGSKGLAVESFGLGEGGVRSSFVKSITPGTDYEISLKARAEQGSATLKLEYWDSGFHLLSEEQTVISGNTWKTYSVKDQAPDKTAYLTLSVSTDNGLVYFDEASSAPVVREIGQNLQLFIDDYLIDSTANVQRNIHQATTQKTNLTGRWIYGNVLYDEQDGIYKMWCQGSGMTFYYYASANGINWASGTACSYTKDGKTLTHLASPNVFRFDNGDGTYTYKMIAFNHYDETGSSSFANAKYYLLSSDDGIQWEYVKTIFSGALDVITVAYDTVNEEYVCVMKKPLVFEANKRTQRMMVSKDLENWSTPIRMYSLATPQDDGNSFLRTDSYGAGLYPLGDSYVGFDWRMRIDQLPSYGYVDDVLLFSRDLTEDWQRPFADTPLIAVNNGNACVYTANAPIRVGDETWLYYGAQESNHGTTASYYIGIAKWRLNGFVSLDTASTQGSIQTRPFLFNGSKLYVNANVSGNLKAELLDESGNVISGFALSDCNEITSSNDGVNVALSWKGNSNLSALRGRTISVHFVSTNTELYSMQVQ